MTTDKHYTSVQGVDLETEGDMVVLAQNRQGEFEPETFVQFYNYVRRLQNRNRGKAVTFVDVGAYTGIYSIFAATIGCNVEAFEPNPDVFQRLKKNVDYNFDKTKWKGLIRYHNIALSDIDYEKTCAFHVTNNPNIKLTSAGSLNLPRTVEFEFSGAIKDSWMYEVRVNSYSALKLPSPDIVKIDVEGHELNVLRGMENHLTNIKPPIVIVEANENVGLGKLVDYMEGEIGGYKFTGLCDTRNLIFVPEYITIY